MARGSDDICALLHAENHTRRQVNPLYKTEGREII